MARRALLSNIFLLVLALSAGFGWAWWHYRQEIVMSKLADGTQVCSLSQTQVMTDARFPRPRALRVDGIAVFTVPAAPEHLVIRSRLMRMSVAGPARVVVMANASERGEQVQVIRGRVTVSKNYPSPHDDADQLGGGEMSMVNQDIDLMEKETFRPAEIARTLPPSLVHRCALD